MQTIQHINIPKPCHQSWEQMTPENNGRNCSNCSKVVTDFTTMTDSQIINYLAKNNNICGRIDQLQLTGINQLLKVEQTPLPGRFKAWILTLGLLGSMSFFKANAQTKPAVEQTADKSPTICSEPVLGKMAVINPTRIIKGFVLDDYNQLIPGATISAGPNIIAQTASNGAFVLSAPSGTQQFKVSFIGYNTQIVTIDNNLAFYNIKLKEAYEPLMGDVVIIKRPSFIKRTYNKFIKRPIRKLFK